jgi:hypothetical protein
MEAGRMDAMEAHLAGCPSCARYDRVVSEGVEELLGVGELEPSYDFLPRLQHRLYNMEEEAARWSRRDRSGTSVGFVALLALLIAAAAWLPLMRSQVAVVELPPVAATAPRTSSDASIHALFRAGPLLGPEPRQVVAPAPNAAASTVFFRYSPMGVQAGFVSETGRRR